MGELAFPPGVWERDSRRYRGAFIAVCSSSLSSEADGGS